LLILAFYRKVAAKKSPQGKGVKPFIPVDFEQLEPPEVEDPHEQPEANPGCSEIFRSSS
jgi:hypothetical protein